MKKCGKAQGLLKEFPAPSCFFSLPLRFRGKVFSCPLDKTQGIGYTILVSFETAT